jgi:hypothetical protein
MPYARADAGSELAAPVASVLGNGAVLAYCGDGSGQWVVSKTRSGPGEPRRRA